MNLASLFLTRSPKRLIFFALLPLLIGFGVFLITARSVSPMVGYAILLFSAALSQTAFILYTTALSFWISGRSIPLIVTTSFNVVCQFWIIVFLVLQVDGGKMLFAFAQMVQIIWSSIVTHRWLTSEGQKYGILDFIITTCVTAIPLVGAWNLHWRGRLLQS
ncbi:hypothetical protein [Phaeocystidibacter marisrubri]|uniref:Uncharacterized protein n=1 Tax=Phaeocystidibacter marisrubri TaxID=1577780 RepID=A0A6L3ZJ32_9FLAO|nr:hypothetical protein [Phaeocystidibacter marisrubri]KAB2817558.1 hypothetical protein F8C82_03930 [Phaeocystidibacter marisrubri]